MDSKGVYKGSDMRVAVTNAKVMTDKAIKAAKINKLILIAITEIMGEFQRNHSTFTFVLLDTLKTKVKYEITSSKGFVFSFPYFLKKTSLKNRKADLLKCLNIVSEIDGLISEGKIKRVVQKNLWQYCHSYNYYNSGYQSQVRVQRGGFDLKITKNLEVALNRCEINDRDVAYRASVSGMGNSKQEFTDTIQLLFGLPFSGELVPIEKLKEKQK